MPVASNTSGTMPTFQITINDTQPIWGYCGQTGHCQAGMVFGINAPMNGSNTFTAFQMLAKSSNATASGGASTQTKSRVRKIAKAALIAIIAGIGVLLLLSVLICYCCCCRRRGGSRAISGGQTGGKGFMGFGAAKYRSLNVPAPEAAA